MIELNRPPVRNPILNHIITLNPITTHTHTLITTHIHTTMVVIIVSTTLISTLIAVIGGNNWLVCP